MHLTYQQSGANRVPGGRVQHAAFPAVSNSTEHLQDLMRLRELERGAGSRD